MAELSRAQWEDIREEYEGGASQASLAKRYGVSRKAVQNHITKEGWTVAGGVTPATMRPMLLPIPTDATTIARIGLSQLARHLQTDSLLEIKDHKSLSDALAQYVKVLVTAPQQEQPEQEDGLFIPLGRISPETRMEIRRLLALDAQEREQVS